MWTEGREEHDNKTKMDLETTPSPVKDQENEDMKIKSSTPNTEDKVPTKRKGSSMTSHNKELIQFEIEADKKGNVYKVLPKILENIKKMTSAIFYDDEDNEMKPDDIEKMTATEINNQLTIVQRKSYRRNSPRYTFTETIKMKATETLEEIKFTNNKKEPDVQIHQRKQRADGNNLVKNQ